MTVTYTGEVATCKGFGCFWKLLFRWKGSIYKLLWPNLIVYAILYYSLSITYRFFLDHDQRKLFEKMSMHCYVFGDLIPVSFVLGFYVSIVIKRWWDQYLCLPWPDNLALFVSSLIHGQDDRGRIMRRTIMRYVNLSLLITLRMISPRVKKRFPTLDHVVEAGWMLSGEKKIFEDLEQKTLHAKYWMPLVWAGGIVTRARKEGRIKDDIAVKTIIDELNTFRAGCGGMLNYDWISIPLVYTQVVTLAVYVYFLSTLMGSQFLDPAKEYQNHQIDLIFPAFTFMQFFFYMGWLKVAESLVNPFGEDDDDFELNWLLDRNLQISYVIVDEMHQEHPEMLKDQYWDEVIPVELPYTAAAKQYQTGPPQYSAEEVEVPSHKAEFMPLDNIVEERVDYIESDSQNADVEVEHPSVQRGETHPMKIKRRPRTSSATNSISVQSSYSNKGKNSVLSLLSRIFHHNTSSKEEMNKLGSSVSLSRRGNRSTSRVSVSQSVAPSRCSFVRESAPYNDYQVEVFSMSDLDIPASIPVTIEDERKRVKNIDMNQQSVSVAPHREYRETDVIDQDVVFRETSPGMQRKDMKVSIAEDPLNFERKEISPTHLFYNDLFKRKDSVARVIVQNNSPVYHVFAPVASTAYVPSARSSQKENQPKTMTEFEVTDKEGGNHTDRNAKSGICPEGLITIMPPADIPRLPLSSAKTVEVDSSSDSSYFPKTEGETGVVFKPSPTVSFSYEEHYPILKEPVQPPLYTCDTTSPIFTGTIKTQKFRDVLSDLIESPNQNIQEAPGLLNHTLKGRCDKPLGDAKTILLHSETEDIKSVSDSCTLNISLSKTKAENSDVVVPDQPTPSVAIPVPAVSQAHAAPSGDLELGGRRTIVHELEPIIEHRDEGAISPESSMQETNIT